MPVLYSGKISTRIITFFRIFLSGCPLQNLIFPRFPASWGPGVGNFQNLWQAAKIPQRFFRWKNSPWNPRGHHGCGWFSHPGGGKSEKSTSEEPWRKKSTNQIRFDFLGDLFTDCTMLNHHFSPPFGRRLFQTYFFKASYANPC